jgi:hypothetical protein
VGPQGSVERGILVAMRQRSSKVGAGERKFIHAASSIQQVTVSTLDEPYYVARYVGARRLVGPTASVTS